MNYKFRTQYIDGLIWNASEQDTPVSACTEALNIKAYHIYHKYSDALSPYFVLKFDQVHFTKYWCV